MKRSLDFVTIGSSLLDTFVMLGNVTHRSDPSKPGVDDECFALGEKIEVRRICQQSGGGATNAAVTFARQRLSGAVVSKMGDDASASLILDELKKDGVATQFINRIKGAGSGQSVVLVDPDAERTVLTDRGSVGALGVQDLSPLDDLQARWVYITSLNGSLEALDHIFTWARQKGVKIAWNPGMADLEKHTNHFEPLMVHTDLFLVNRDEAAELTGFSGNVDELAGAIHKMGVARAIVSNGSEPLAVVDGNQLWTLEPHDVKAIDQTGAGDACGSGTVAGLLRGMTFRQSVDLGLANAEHVILHVGAKTGIIYRK